MKNAECPAALLPCSVNRVGLLSATRSRSVAGSALTSVSKHATLRWKP